MLRAENRDTDMAGKKQEPIFHMDDFGMGFEDDEIERTHEPLDLTGFEDFDPLGELPGLVIPPGVGGTPAVTREGNDHEGEGEQNQGAGSAAQNLVSSTDPNQPDASGMASAPVGGGVYLRNPHLGEYKPGDVAARYIGIGPSGEYVGPPVPHPPQPKRLKPGRSPALLRHEVETIKLDDRPIAVLARAYKVSEMTIRRVKGRGVFAYAPYIPADEYERELVPSRAGQTKIVPASEAAPYDASDVTFDGNEDHGGDEETSRGAGRPYLRRQVPLSDGDRVHIMLSREPIRDIAAKYGVSTATITRLRRRSHAALPVHTSGPREGEQMTLQEAIRADPRSAAQVAKHYGVTPALVNYVRDDYVRDEETGETDVNRHEEEEMPNDGQDDPHTGEEA